MFTVTASNIELFLKARFVKHLKKQEEYQGRVETNCRNQSKNELFSDHSKHILCVKSVKSTQAGFSYFEHTYENPT